MEFKFSHIMDNVRPSEIRELLKYASQPGMISLGGGMPNPSSFAVDEIREISDYVLENYGPLALQYGNTGGYDELRKQLAIFLGEMEGIRTQAGNIIVTTGSQQALYSVGKILVNQDEFVITESPTYIGAISAFRACGIRMEGIAMDEQGMRTDLLQVSLEKHRTEGKMPRFIYVIPNFQNPSGYTLSMERRKHLIDLSADFNVPIVEDNPYGHVRFSGNHLPNLKSMTNDNRVIYLGTFSKIMSPGLRIGFVSADESVVGKINLLKQGLELSGSTLTEFIAAEYLKRGIMKRKIPEVARMYGRKRDIMLKALEDSFPEWASWSKPEGGMFVWATLGGRINTSKMIARAIENKVTYISGASFYPEEIKYDGMRLNFTFPSDDDIPVAIKRLASVIDMEVKAIEVSR
ncbi:MAG: PLP-dependent aminotransferase family protein [Candidatus Thermoplasmatota archaeon]|jgi:2-aminoadipate transaminase|nr:PLP-dependent aminotransferase family protein [Candidatus Thermoplasmatota archaeon]